MTERVAHLVDAVLPWVPVRQWVLTVPYRLRYQMAWNHGLSRAVLHVYTRVLLDAYARGARERGLAGGQTGMVTALQRAGSGLNVNPHFHTLVLDGVFAEDAGGALVQPISFAQAPRISCASKSTYCSCRARVWPRSFLREDVTTSALPRYVLGTVKRSLSRRETLG
jgi:putative transposase